MRRVPDVVGAERDYDFREVSGRDGTVTIDKKKYLDIETELELYLEDEEYEDASIAFLQGSGDVIFQKFRTGYGVSLSSVRCVGSAYCAE